MGGVPCGRSLLAQSILPAIHSGSVSAVNAGPNHPHRSPDRRPLPHVSATMYILYPIYRRDGGLQIVSDKEPPVLNGLYYGCIITGTEYIGRHWGPSLAVQLPPPLPPPQLLTLRFSHHSPAARLLRCADIGRHPPPRHLLQPRGPDRILRERPQRGVSQHSDRKEKGGFWEDKAPAALDARRHSSRRLGE